MSKVFKALERAEREQSRALSEKKRELSQGADTEPRGVVEPLRPFAAAGSEASPTDNELSPSLFVHSHPDAVSVEQIKRIRTYVMHCVEGPNPPRTIMVTSAIPGEGKSLLAANLAVSIAQGLQDYVLLVDADIRKPTVHRFFGQPQGPGLSDYLNGEAELSTIIRHSGIKKLSFIPSGEKKKNPLELLSSRRMKELIASLREKYDDRLVLFDATPVLLTNEPVVLSKMIDGILFVVRHDTTSRDAVKKALAILSKERIIGLIMNDYTVSSAWPYGYRYEEYYGKYYGLEKGKRSEKSAKRKRRKLFRS